MPSIRRTTDAGGNVEDMSCLTPPSKAIRGLLLCLALGPLTAGLAGCPGRTEAERFNRIRRLIRTELVKAPHIPSIAVAVARDGTIIWEEGFGWADREKHMQATAHTRYPLASTSKPLTATGLMVLIQAGKVDLDRPINDYLGSAKVYARVGDAAQATVRRVANHSSGLPLHYQFFYADEPYRPPPMDETILRYAHLVTIPGEKYEYSNVGYGILGHVIARVSGKPYADFMREEVFVKLGLTHTSVGPCARPEEACATRYGSNGGIIPVTDFDTPAAGAIYASAHDLVRFALFHLKAHLADQTPILSEESIVEMQRATASSGPHAGTESVGLSKINMDTGSSRMREEWTASRQR
jgi:CubicO group peptidase (beta-lactamase class C family)